MTSFTPLISQLPDFDMRQLSEADLDGRDPGIHAVEPDLRVFVMGHLGDGNLHYTIAKDTLVEHLYFEIATALYTGLNAIGGSFSAEHGIGTEKQASLREFVDSTKLSLMHAVKTAIDPMNIMNPGKVLPSK
ncbi:hypothetical protein N9C22_02100 [Paracoccaceae bacterium]|nr:hypothetical protein [Paracoccaceae bacterium]